MKKVFLVVHSFNGETQVEVCATRKTANRVFRSILEDYVNEGTDINTKAKNDTELYEATDGKVCLHIQTSVVHQ